MTVTCPSCQRPVDESAAPIVMDDAIYWNGQSAKLSRAEARVLRTLPFTVGRISRKEISERVYGWDTTMTNRIDVHISRMRERLARLGLVVCCIRTHGYYLDVTTTPSPIA